MTMTMEGKAERGAGIMAGLTMRGKAGIRIEVIMEGSSAGVVVETMTG
jgi:hypothetical protein